MLHKMSLSVTQPILGTLEGGLYSASLFVVVAMVAFSLDLLVRLLRRLGASEAVCRTLEMTALGLLVLDCIVVLAAATAHAAHSLVRV